MASENSARCSSVPNRSIMITCGKFPTIDDSSCRSLCSPRPLCARCSRITAISTLVPSRPPREAGSPYRSHPAASARRRISSSSSSHSRRGTPPRSTSVRANSRRWSKYCMCSACSGAISRSMKSSISASTPGRCSGSVKSMAIPSALGGQRPYRVFLQIVDNVSMASLSLICHPGPDGPTNTTVKFSNSSAMAAAMWSGSSSRP
nr:hypothetical protein CPGR_00795 [Mycolicibacter nonchromogenicus]